MNMVLKTPLIAALMALLIGACASPSPHFDQHFGSAINAAQAQQTVNPEASRNTDAVVGIGGTPADSAMKEYHNSFRSPPPTFPVINIGVGGGR
jgi:hypothetical protein